MRKHRVIHLQPKAPAKPAMGEPCNGCGVCCLSEPCPLGVVVSRRRTGACAALRWDESARHYRCGVLLRAQGRWWAPWVRRWIASGQGCDAALEIVSEPAQQHPAAARDQQQ